MARLILEEGGAKRAFRFQEGKLTIGSGEGCTLTLSSPDIAEIHCDLEFGEGRVVLRARPGVQPPTVNGEPAPGETVLRVSTMIQIGGATLQVDLDESAPVASAAAKKPAAPQVVAKKSAATKVTPRRATGPAKGAMPAPRTGGARVQRTTRTVSKGMPQWVLGLIGGALLLVGFLVFKNMGTNEGTGYNPVERYKVAVSRFNEAHYGASGDSLDLIDEQTYASMDPSLRAKYKELRGKLEEKRKETERSLANMIGTEWKSTQLDRFRTQRLTGTNPPNERVRVYLKRVKEFKSRWPTHPELDEVLRYEARFKEICDLSQPATYTDLAYEVETMTWAKPRNFKGAFALIERHRAANPGDEAQVNELVALKQTLQSEQFTEMMLQAKYEWEKEERGQAVAGLVQIITLFEDASMATKAAEELVRLPGIEEWLRGYKTDRAEKYAELIRHPVIAAKVIAAEDIAAEVMSIEARKLGL